MRARQMCSFFPHAGPGVGWHQYGAPGKCLKRAVGRAWRGRSVHVPVEAPSCHPFPAGPCQGSMSLVRRPVSGSKGQGHLSYWGAPFATLSAVAIVKGMERRRVGREVEKDGCLGGRKRACESAPFLSVRALMRRKAWTQHGRGRRGSTSAWVCRIAALARSCKGTLSSWKALAVARETKDQELRGEIPR